MLIEIRRSPIHGHGVFAKKVIRPGTIQNIYGYLTEYIPGSQTERYGFEWDDKYHFVPWAPWCFLNHSTEPNCYVYVEGDNVFIEAIERIYTGSELTIDYGFDPTEKWGL